MSLLGSFVFGRENDGLFGSRLLGRARMLVRGLASGRSWCLVRYDFAPFFAPISAFSRFLCIGFFGSFFFFIFPLFSLDSSSFWCGCSVIETNKWYVSFRRRDFTSFCTSTSLYFALMYKLYN